MAAYIQRWQGGHGAVGVAPVIQQDKAPIPTVMHTSSYVSRLWVRDRGVLWPTWATAMDPYT
jgi:hypothetical protein